MLHTTPAPTEFLDTIAGLPIHPLVVHVAVVVLPLSAMGLLAIMLVPKWRAPFGWLTLGGLAVGAAAAVAAAQSGEALAERVGEPKRHADLGKSLEILAPVLLAVAVVWFLVQRQAAKSEGEVLRVLGPGLEMIAGIATLALAFGTLVLVTAVGHSGAQAAWGGVVNSQTGGGDD